MKYSDELMKTINADKASGVVEMSSFSDKAIRQDIAVLEKGDVLIPEGKVYKTIIKGTNGRADNPAEYMLAKTFHTKNGKIVGDPFVSKFFPGTLTKQAFEVDAAGVLTGTRYRTGGEVAENFRNDISGMVGTAFHNHVEGKAIKVTEDRLVRVKDLNKEDATRNTHIYNFDYFEGKIPE